MSKSGKGNSKYAQKVKARGGTQTHPKVGSGKRHSAMLDLSGRAPCPSCRDDVYMSTGETSCPRCGTLMSVKPYEPPPRDWRLW